MAATILSGTGNVSWTNNTGGNVRVVVNYFGSNNVASTTNGVGISISAGGPTFTASFAKAIGKNLAFSGGAASLGYVSNNMIVNDTNESTQQALPIEFYVPATQTFSITLSNGTASYNILILPEDG
jgi:hypothetical protein